jgi:hypothetical protein
MNPRNLIGDALAALDQSLTVADEGTAFDRDYWLQRAAVNAAVAQAQQSRVSNLIAWKQLRQSAPATALTSGGDAITAEIEDALGITDPETEAGA